MLLGFFLPYLQDWKIYTLKSRAGRISPPEWILFVFTLSDATLGYAELKQFTALIFLEKRAWQTLGSVR